MMQADLARLHGVPTGHARRKRSGALDGFRGRIPSDPALPEVGFICHVASQRGMMTEHCILHHRFSALDGAEEIPQMRLHVIEIISLVVGGFCEWFLAGLRIVLCMPLLQILLAHGPWEAHRIVAGRGVLASLRRIGKTVLS